ncbi:MAG: phosphatase PAP2 family protein [Sphingomonadales bacterium]|nr:MAG: phosphatase PAP2 family protein [Sphingomonadales bacterium]
MRYRSALSLGILMAGAAPAHARNTKTWSDAGGIARDALIVAALGVPAVQGDWRGDLEAGGSIGAAFPVTRGLKEAIHERRPDGSDNKSFPSGHASASFAAAALLQNRYGWQVGLPAQLVAAFVGVSRVEARKHHWWDVAAGAAIGEAGGFLLTTKRDAGVRVVPWGDTHSGGAALTMRFK